MHAAKKNLLTSSLHAYVHLILTLPVYVTFQHMMNITVIDYKA